MNSNNLRLSMSVLDNEELQAVTNVMQNDGYLGMGIEVLHFEKEIAKSHFSKEAIFSSYFFVVGLPARE